MDEQTQNVATALKWCRDENQKLRQELYDLKHDKEVLEARNEELEEELTEQKDDMVSVRGHFGLRTKELADSIKNLREEKKVLEEQLKHHFKWFEEINRLVGADPSEPSVNAVSDYVREHS